MQRSFFRTSLLSVGGLLAVVIVPALAYGQDAATASLRGRWQAVEMVDDGRVIPQEAIPTWIPSGGQVEVIDNTFVFNSTADGQRHARTFDVDATRYPYQINLRNEGQVYAHGIYQIDQGRLVICAAPVSAARPTDFSSPKSSQRVLLVLKRSGDGIRPAGEPPAGTALPAGTAPTANTAPPAGTAPISLPPGIGKTVPTSAAATSASPPSGLELPKLPPELPKLSGTELPKLPPPPDLRSVPGTTGRLLTDAEVIQMILGTWKYKDAYGDFFLTLDSRGTFNTYREAATTSAFQQVFVRAPVSSGTWVLNNGQLTFRVTTSVNRDRINQQAPYAVRSVSQNDLIFMDARGQVVKGIKVR